MPKTADKRAQARRVTRVQRAHQQPLTSIERRVERRPPLARRKARRRGAFAVLRDYPWATLFFIALLVGLSVLFAQQQKLGPFAPPQKKAVAQATCNLTTHTCTKAPIMTIDKNKTYTATIKTDKGDIVIALDAKNTPVTVNNFVFLAQQHYYDGTYFWRVEQVGKPSPLSGDTSSLQLVQGGSVQKDGKDNAKKTPGYTFNDEAVVGDYTPGTVAMANSGPNTNAAQFFIDTGDNSGGKIAQSYTIFGKVTSGLDVAQKIQPDDTIQSVTISVK